MFFRIGSDEDDEEGDDLQSAEDPSETAVSVSMRATRLADLESQQVAPQAGTTKQEEDQVEKADGEKEEKADEEKEDDSGVAPDVADSGMVPDGADRGVTPDVADGGQDGVVVNGEVRDTALTLSHFFLFNVSPACSTRNHDEVGQTPQHILHSWVASLTECGFPLHSYLHLTHLITAYM